MVASAFEVAAVARLAHGTLPPSWVDGTRPDEPRVQTWAFEPSTFILRQSPRTHFEAPFVYLFLGARQALLVDTGTGNAGLRAAIDDVLRGRELELYVAHTHGHSDHVGGDAELLSRPNTITIPMRVIRSIELGGRTIDVIPIPGHDPQHVAFYDRKTGILLTGDTFYPGRLYVRDLSMFRASIERLVRFAESRHPIAHILGSHIELSSAGVEYAEDAQVHRDEHALALSVDDLYDLRTTIRRMGMRLERTARPHYVIVPA
jgi:glyoxylase-like metal-dependent hydrolase (beta-lactamase superfamily II)